MKKILVVIFTLLFAVTTAANALNRVNPGNKKARDGFYSVIQKTFGFSKEDCRFIRAKGYVPQFALTLLYIAKESGRPVSELAALRDNGGLSPAEICAKYNIDYPALMDKLKAEIIKNNITVPPADSSEMKKTVARSQKKGGE
jgi:hypothetical protein